jgi:hypothetical protein
VRSAVLFLVFAQAALAADPPGTQPCATIPATARSPTELQEAVVEARLSALKHWRNADGESLAAEGCEQVYWGAYKRLVDLNNDAAAQAAVQLLIDPRLHWDAGDALTAVDITARLGDRVKPHLLRHVHTSELAKFTVECINRGGKTCT